MVSPSTTPHWLNENKEFVKYGLQYCFAFNENKKIVKSGLQYCFAFVEKSNDSVVSNIWNLRDNL